MFRQRHSQSISLSERYSYCLASYSPGQWETLLQVEKAPWWYVNLLEPYMVQLVRIDFGQSCCGRSSLFTFFSIFSVSFFLSFPSLSFIFTFFSFSFCYKFNFSYFLSFLTWIAIFLVFYSWNCRFYWAGNLKLLFLCAAKGRKATIVVRVGNNRPDLGVNPICNRSVRC